MLLKSETFTLKLVPPLKMSFIEKYLIVTISCSRLPEAFSVTFYAFLVGKIAQFFLNSLVFYH